ncbi:MAG: tetratricopeptide repeat protein [Deltaproteobacteria bacterium]|nr:tetratricopeptide repeat protein [Myxococcales bacterium]MDP3212491.1 tetratricopeptide repeat protein [Deltaproteobacteria bacterium]
MSGAIDEAVTFEDEDGEANALSMEFATATMGHVLLGQGRHDAAREVFRAALAKDPGDAEAARGLRMMGEPAAAGRVAVTGLAHAVDPTTVYARWSDGDVGRALVVVSLWVDGGRLRRDEREEAVAPGAGEAFVRGLRPGASHHLAVGLRTDEGFTPTVTMGPVLTPGAAPSERVATELLPVGRRPDATLFEEALDAWQRTVMPSS